MNAIKKFKEVGDRKDSCEAMTSDSKGNLYYGLLTQGSLMMWNVSDVPMDKQAEVVVQNPEKFVWINSLFISEGSIWVVTNRFGFGNKLLNITYNIRSWFCSLTRVLP